MGSSNASRNGRGGTASGARHAKHAFDEGGEGLFALSLDDVMSDRPWTAEELMRSSPDKCKARTFRHARAGIRARGRLWHPSHRAGDA